MLDQKEVEKLRLKGFHVLFCEPQHKLVIIDKQWNKIPDWSYFNRLLKSKNIPHEVKRDQNDSRRKEIWISTDYFNCPHVNVE
jgi:hypothetical protein